MESLELPIRLAKAQGNPPAKQTKVKHPKYNKGYYKNKKQRRKKKFAARRAAFAANPEMQGDPNLSTNEEDTEWMKFWDENGNPIEEDIAADEEMEQERKIETGVKKSKKQRRKETHLARRAANKAVRGGESRKERKVDGKDRNMEYEEIVVDEETGLRIEGAAKPALALAFYTVVD